MLILANSGSLTNCMLINNEIAIDIDIDEVETTNYY